VNQGQPQTFQQNLQNCNPGKNYLQSNVQPFGSPFSFVTDASNASRTDVLVSSLGPNGAVPSNWGVYYKFVATQPTPTLMQSLTQAQMTLLGHLNGVSALFPLPATTMSDVIVFIFTPTGEVVNMNWQTLPSGQPGGQRFETNVQSFNGLYFTVEDRTNQSRSDLAFAELGPNGAVPSNWGVYYKFVATPPSQAAMQSMTPSQMTLLGRLNAIETILPIPTSSTNLPDLIVGIFASNGQLVNINWSPVQNLRGWPSWQSNFWAYATSSGYRFVALATDQFGNPLPGVNCSISLTSGSSVYNEQALTNSSGFASLIVTAPVTGGASLQATMTPSDTGLQPWSQSSQLNTQYYPWTAAFFGYPAANGFHFLGLAADQYGSPLAGVNCTISATIGNATYNHQLLTNGSGLASYYLQAPSGRGAAVQVTMTPASPGLQPWGGQNTVQAYYTQQGNGVQFLGGTPGGTVLDSSNKSRFDTIVISFGSNFTAPTPYSIYYRFTSSVLPQQTLAAMKETQMHLLGQVTRPVTVLPLPLGANSSEYIVTGFFAPDGTQLNIGSGSAAYVLNPSTGLAEALAPDFVFLTPVVGILAAYSAYGKERASGVYESIITRPVTRRGLAVSRYLSVLIVLAIASVLGVVVATITAQELVGISLGPVYQLALMLGVFVEAMAFAGIVFLFSTLMKSTGKILGIVAAIYFIANFGMLFVGVIFSSIPLTTSVAISFVNPARYVNLVLSYVGGVNIFTLSEATINLSAIGITPLTLAAGAALWVLLPFLASLYFAVKRD